MVVGHFGAQAIWKVRYLTRAQMVIASSGVLQLDQQELIKNTRSRQRNEKLRLRDGRDLYELPKADWRDEVDIWLSMTYIQVGMYTRPVPTLVRTCQITRASNVTRVSLLDGKGQVGAC